MSAHCGLLALALLVLSVLPAAAEDPDPRCASAKTDDLIACAAAKLAKEDAAMDDLLAQAKAAFSKTDESMRKIDPKLGYDSVGALTAEQDAWTHYREASQLTKDRTADLRTVLESVSRPDK